MRPRDALSILLLLAMGLTGCRQRSAADTVQIARFPVDSFDHLLTTSGVHLDNAVSNDGKGSLRIEAEKPVVVSLYEVTDIDVENTRLLYAAHLRTENLEGRAYLEMWLVFEDVGEFFSRGLADPLIGTVGWTRREIPFFLKTGENPDRVKLNLVVDGRGTVWIDDIVVSKSAD